jgi:hypothetical protein
MIQFPSDTVFIDIETHSITERYSMPPEEYFRIGGYTWGEDPTVYTTTSYAEMIRVIRSARVVVGHNIHMFDLSVLFGVDSVEPVEMARRVAIFDTMTHATLALPAPDGEFFDRNGTRHACWKPEHYLKWFKLDNLAFQLGVPGKLEDVLKRLAKEAEHELIPNYSEKTGKLLKNPKKIKREVCCGFGWKTLPYAFKDHGLDYEPVRIELIGPGYSRWIYGPEDAPSKIKGSASDWARIAVRRIEPNETRLKVTGDAAEAALKVAQAFL